MSFKVFLFPFRSGNCLFGLGEPVWHYHEIIINLSKWFRRYLKKKLLESPQGTLAKDLVLR